MANFYVIVTEASASDLCFTKGDFNALLRKYKEEGTKVLSVRTLYPIQGVEIVPPPVEDEFEDFI